jgi:aspartyl-tRNA synthetase
MLDYRRTHTCGELTKKNIENKITLSGWVNRRRDHGGLIFIDLRDRFGVTQLVFDPTICEHAHDLAQKLRSEFVICVKGEVRHRGDGLENPKMETGEIEIKVEEMEILSKSKIPPFSVCDENVDVKEDLRLKYRYLDIRRGDISKKLQKRHLAMLTIRNYLDKKGFLEITTPVLSKSTPEGARDYLVPARIYPGNFYALPQSPQIFKQLLMISSMDKYFQIAQCFRDEDMRADRQPEFTQLDLEMSFNTLDEIYSLIEGLLKDVFKACVGVDIKTPFIKMPHSQCMEKYGTDRPDMRFGMELNRLDEIVKDCEFSVIKDQLNRGGVVKAIVVKGGEDVSRRMIDEYTAFVAKFGLSGLAWMKLKPDGFSSSIVKFFSQDQLDKIKDKLNVEIGDLVLIATEKEKRVNQALDHLRRKIAKDRKLIKDGDFKFLWVCDFPLFSYDEKEDRLKSEHHPFTCPNFEDIDLIEKDPTKVRSLAYDIVVNGYELGGGSQRIHNSELQEKIFKALNLSDQEIKKKFGFFIEALQYGTPPHLGIALGLDRFIMLLTKTENIKDVIAFPKTQKASDLMSQAPSKVVKEQLDDLGLKTDEEKCINIWE